MDNLKNTPLYKLHLELGARMVPFAGYQMPIQYPHGIISEHLHCRRDAGFFDISHMGQCLIRHPDAASILDTLTPSNITALETGRQRYTVLTNQHGGIIDDIIISRLQDGYLVVINAACKEKDLTYLHHHFGPALTELTDQALFAVQGPGARQVMKSLSAEAGQLKFLQLCRTLIDNIDCIVSCSGYTGEDGFEISVSNENAETLATKILSYQQVEPIGLGARDTLRLEAGLSLYGHELSESITPVEAGLSWLIKTGKTNYPGAPVIHKQLQDKAPRKRVALLVDGKIPLRDQCEILDQNDQVIGFCTSGSYSPTLKQPIALALIEHWCDETALFAQIRNRRISTRITTLPFIPHHYYRG